MMKIAYQGVRGAYSEIALLEHFGPSVKAIGFALSEQVFEAVESGKVDGAIVPVENSIAGSVGVNADLLLHRPVFVTGETYLPIEHCLLGRPGDKLNDIKKVFSHPVALAQCRDFLNSHHMMPMPEYDTAGAAEMIASKGEPGQAAIASKRCAEIYGLKVLSKAIQSVENNTTRFLTFVAEFKVPARLKMEKTSLAFSVHHHPGALIECLKCFANHQINLTKLESRPIPSNPFEYFFLTDFLGGYKDPEVKQALDSLHRTARQVKILGSYPVAKRPKRN